MTDLYPHQWGALGDLYAHWQRRVAAIVGVYSRPEDTPAWHQERIKLESELGALWHMPCRSGKTISALSALSLWQSWLQEWGVPRLLQEHWSHPHLILAPSDMVRDVWVEEWGKVVPPWDPRANLIYGIPTLDAEIIRGKLGALPPGSIAVLTYHTLLHRSQVATRRWQVLVADEVHYLKDPYTSWTKVAYQLKTVARLGLSATPFTNYVNELLPVLYMIQGYTVGDRRVSDTWPSKAVWEETICAWSYDNGRKICTGARFPEYLYHKLRAELMYSVTPEEVSDAPEPIIIPVPTPLSDRQLEIYVELAAGMIRWLDRQGNVHSFDSGPVLAQMSYLMGLCADARLLEDSIRRAKGDNITSGVDSLFAVGWDSENLNSKLRALRWILEGQAAGEQVLILTGYSRLAKLLEVEIDGVESITGDVPTIKRQGIQQRFASGETRIIVATRAAWEGITLAAPFVVLFGFVDWTPGKVRQAIRRAWTMKDKEAVRVFDIYAPNTVEEWNRNRLAVKDSQAGVMTNGKEAPLFRSVGDLKAALGKVVA